jgi:hypothetical protein
MKNKYDSNITNRILKLSPRTFSYSQLSKISDDNFCVLNRSIDMSAFNNNDVFELYPRMEHNHAFGKPVNAHLRTLVKKLNEPMWLAYQDLTYEQWAQGYEGSKIAS